MSEPRLARNIIVFMGDGMGAEQLATGRWAANGRLHLDVLAGPVLVQTDSLTTQQTQGPDALATDSAAAATAIATGVIVANDVLSIAPNGAALGSVLELSKQAGKATGLVTTSYFFDASPAAFAAHQHSRSAYFQIASEMLGVTQPEIVMGAGRWILDDPAVAEIAAAAGYVVVRDAKELAGWDPQAAPRLLGLFETDFIAPPASEPFSLTPALERTPASPDPTLATMMRRALEHLSSDPDGFFLFAEDELTDQISHRGPNEVAYANRLLPAEVGAFDAAVRVAIDWVLERSSFDETLIVVLADHETGGYSFDRTLGPVSGTFSAFTDDGRLRVGYHTRTPIELYALGPGSDSLQHIHHLIDTYRLLTGRSRTAP